ncbi:hypothetical protein SASPL_145223 [Salvia splendens]|uniref:DDE Tnp4 domain-containing protein n=1 Tax=Salvia splendens TaxID=180675 RepID=A0A8X8Z860_SALSN|nr:hypothetical protein SASPL_145223 [Salvia splendens]
MFNMWHTKARNVIERAFSVLKMRWDILRSASYYSIKVQIRLMMACFLLHNYICTVILVDPLDELIDRWDEAGGNAEEPIGQEFVDTIEATSERSMTRDAMAQAMWNLTKSNHPPSKHHVPYRYLVIWTDHWSTLGSSNMQVSGIAKPTLLGYPTKWSAHNIMNTHRKEKRYTRAIKLTWKSVSRMTQVCAERGLHVRATRDRYSLLVNVIIQLKDDYKVSAGVQPATLEIKTETKTEVILISDSTKSLQDGGERLHTRGKTKKAMSSEKSDSVCSPVMPGGTRRILFIEEGDNVVNDFRNEKRREYKDSGPDGDLIRRLENAYPLRPTKPRGDHKASPHVSSCGSSIPATWWKHYGQ